MKFFKMTDNPDDLRVISETILQRSMFIRPLTLNVGSSLLIHLLVSKDI